MTSTIAVELFGIKILEPVTVVTNILLFIGCISFANRLSGLNSNSKINLYWKRFFIFLGVSSLLGGVAHAFSYYFGVTFHLITWLTSGIAIYFVELSAILMIKPKGLKKALIFIVFLQLILFTILTLYVQDFYIAKINLSIGAVGFVLTIHLYYYFKEKHPGSSLIATGIILLLSTLFIHSLKLSFTPWFNHNDISHIIMLFCLYLMFLGSYKSIMPKLEM